MQESKKDYQNIIYLSHGGGPLPILNDPSHKAMIDFMKNLPSTINEPELIIIISAHWEETIPTTTGGEDPGLFYDYYGFPKEAYELKYPAKGSPDLAEKVKNKLIEKGIDSAVDVLRKFDHGHFIPLKMMYPKADIPTIQLSLKHSLNPKDHIEMGKALRELDLRNVLIIGSGFSFHNMREFKFDNTNEPDPRNDSFQNWLIDVCTNRKYSQEEREELLINWEQAPNARYCHPREEHLLPLHVCLGMADKEAETIFDDYILGKRAVAFKW